MPNFTFTSTSVMLAACLLGSGILGNGIGIISLPTVAPSRLQRGFDSDQHLGRHQREAIIKIESHPIAKNAAGANTGAINFSVPVFSTWSISSRYCFMSRV